MIYVKYYVIIPVKHITIFVLDILILREERAFMKIKFKFSNSSIYFKMFLALTLVITIITSSLPIVYSATNTVNALSNPDFERVKGVMHNADFYNIYNGLMRRHKIYKSVNRR